MRALKKVEGIVAPLDRPDVDTDQIIPKNYLKRIERTGYGQFLFFDWRLNPDGSPNMEFPLNRPELKGANILLGGRNFGCGSSREHAAWAIEDFGFQAVIAPSFADIFKSNCFQTGIVPIELPEKDVAELMKRSSAKAYKATVDLEAMEIRGEDGLKIPFQIDPTRRHRLMNGLDDIGLTLTHEDDITRYEKERAVPASWVA
jgi:3-isopropylmalate/(R)-2-methylmalate dehydratase small subunit